VRPVAPVSVEPAALKAAGERASLKHAAEAFEALLVQSLLKSMTEAQLEEGFFGDGPGASTYQAVFQEQLAERLAEGSPFGIARMIEEQWAGRVDAAQSAGAALRKAAEVRAREAYGAAVESAGGAMRNAPVLPVEQPVPSTPSAAPISPARPVPAGAGATTAPAPQPPSDSAPHRPESRNIHRTSASVSSPYGWRTDPFDGSLRFHHGVDLPAPEGTAVLAVAPGEVVSAERRPGFGLEVLVRHAEGWLTRYAHLSGADVRPGQKVARGALLGKVGSTGRSTGPHLHFEAAREGRAVDPGVAAPGSLRAQVLRHGADEI
jgi:murein DD-endopeptidase MepM/ murein hydrolase activator NlpD